MAEQLFQIGIKGLIRDAQSSVLLVGRHGREQGGGHQDLPGGRMEPGESFLQALERELTEEIGVSYDGEPKQFAALLSNITIPVGDERVPLVLVIYEAKLPIGAVITPGADEEVYEWVTPAEAADRLRFKYPADFCERIAAL